MLQKYRISGVLVSKDMKHIVSLSAHILIFIPLFLTSCMPSYQSHLHTYKKNFSTSHSESPNYEDLMYWAAHPDKPDPSDSVPRPLQNELRDTLADVFFIHPTTFLKNKRKPVSMNPSMLDAELNAKTDYSSILYQASVFNGSCKIYAPRYRQAHISAFFTKDTNAAQQAFELAYRDIRSAFEYYLTHYHHGRPIIIASHSQGTLHAARLLKEFFEEKPLSNYLVVAYLWGMPIPPHYFSALSLCRDSAQTGCFAGWRLYKQGYIPSIVRREKYISLSVNPISWKPDSIYVKRSSHLGAVLFNFNKVYSKTQGARIHKGVVWIDKPKFPFSFLYTQRNYHAGDINLFYIDIRKNINQRIRQYFSTKEQ
jgi:hypothetical protein